MRRSLTRVTAMLLTLCSLLALFVPATSAETTTALEPETLLDGVIYNDFGLSKYYGLGVVGGHDYLYVPYLHMLYVFDLDTWEKVDEQAMGNGTCHGAFVDSTGIVWVYGAKDTLYRYDPVAKEGYTVALPTEAMNFSKVYSPIEVNGKIYFGTYGPAATGGAHIVEFDPATGVFTDMGKLVTGGVYCSALTYHNGYIYATAQANKAAATPQYVVKFDPLTKQVVDQIDTSGKTNAAYFDEIQLVGDVLLLGSAYQKTMLAIDISGQTMSFASLNNTPNAGIEGCISEEVNGKVYFFTWNNRSSATGTWVYYNDFYSYEIATKTFTKLNSYSPVSSEIASQQKNIVTIQNEELGLNGQYIFTMVGADITLYGLDGTVYEMPTLPGASSTANRIYSFTKGPDGTNTIYLSSYMNNTAAIYDIATGEVTLQETISGQLDQNFFYNGKWYITNYGACSLSEVGADGTITTLFTLNEGVNKNYFSQERMHNFTGGGNKVFTSTVPHKGEYGGFIAWYDYDEEATFVAVEEDLVLYATDDAPTTWYNAETDAVYTFTRDFDGLVAGQMIKTLVYHDGYIYASTTAYGGSTTTQQEGVTAKLIVYDPTNMEMVATYDIRDGINGLATDIAAITGIVADPDVPGRFWGLVSGTLFHFTFDAVTKTFNVQEALSLSKANSTGGSPAVWSPWKCYFDDGYLYYYYNDGETGCVMMVSTEDPSYYAALPADTTHRFVLGDDDNLYCSRTTRIQKFNTASLIAQVKASRPATEVEPTILRLGSNYASNWEFLAKSRSDLNFYIATAYIRADFKTTDSTNGHWVAIRFSGDAVAAGTYQLNMYTNASPSNPGNSDVYLLPDTALTEETAVANYIASNLNDSTYLGVFNSTTSNSVAQNFGTVSMDGNDFILVFKCSAGQSGNKRLNLATVELVPALS